MKGNDDWGDFTYEGGVKPGTETRHGRGTCSWSDGEHYEGEWVEGKMSGWGTMTWDDGRYEGGWVKGEMTGWGTFTYARH